MQVRSYDRVYGKIKLEVVQDARHPHSRAQYSPGKYYTYNNKYHRNDGKPAVINTFSRTWYKDGKIHREDGPAVEMIRGQTAWRSSKRTNRVFYRYATHEEIELVQAFEDDRVWWVEGKIHREDGPAIVRATGHVEYWLNNEQYTKEEWETKYV